MNIVSNIQRCLIIFAVCIISSNCTKGQTPTQVLKGIVIDRETRIPLAGANVVILNSNPLSGTSADDNGRFRISIPVGRVTVKATFLGYEDIVVRDILAASGKEVDLTLEMVEQVINAKEIFITASAISRPVLNQMASVSAQTIRTDDALRFAGGFYDPSRIVNGFAGVVTANDDASNDIVIRGNSSRGLLWRLEGIEIPNPNHFGDGQGGSGGAYSAISSNVISDFDFFTGAFPAEYGNAFSGVMDLNLRKGNNDKYEFAFQTGMIGAEISGEGPLSNKSGSSFLVNARYVNFSILSNLNIIDLGETNYAPRSKDMVFNINLPSKKCGSINIFGFYGSSSLGKTAERDPSKWISSDDRWEETEFLESLVAGVKHLFPLQNGKTYLRSVLAFTSFHEKYNEGYIDSAFIRMNNKYQDFNYPSLRFSFLLNNKMSPKLTFRTGLNFQVLNAAMKDYRLISGNLYDTLVNPQAHGFLTQIFAQLKNRISENFEINSGVHILSFSVNGDMTVEPRFGIKWRIAPGSFFNIGTGLHSKIESFPVYYGLIQNSSGIKEPLNKDLGFSNSAHFVTGFDFTVSGNSRLKIEVYNQRLFNIPVIYSTSSRYSSINSSEELPASVLTNKGLGYNRGVEFTFEKNYSRNYYLLYTLSLFGSKYKAGDNKWYNTYYNTSFVTNFLAGKDFYLGMNKKNILGLNTKLLLRGGYRYTPPDYERSVRSQKIIYASSRTYEEQLPGFVRVDGGISFRHNSSGYSWIVMLDIQNITNRKNVFRKRFSFSNGSVNMENVYSLGTVPVFNFRMEF